MTFTTKEVEDCLKDMVKAGYLKKTKKGWMDSDRVTAMLKEGKTRQQIAKILDNKNT
jgi:outer membrane protein assembly factor BamE (lipoprotein component of BamABCDE complex)